MFLKAYKEGVQKVFGTLDLFVSLWRLKSNIRFYKGVFCLFGHPLVHIIRILIHGITDVAHTHVFRIIGFVI